MISRSEYERAQAAARELLGKTSLSLREDELQRIAVADFGLSDWRNSGGQILTLVDDEVIAVKLIAMLPGQTLPQHRHPRLGEYPGKQETLRCEWGMLYLYTEGKSPPAHPFGKPPEGREDTYTVWREVVLYPGDQYTVPRNTWHWFQSGEQGAVVWSMSSRASDVQDEFMDPDIVRTTVVMED